MNRLQVFARFAHKVAAALGAISALMIAFCMFTISIEVIFRLLAGRSISGLIEINETMMAVIFAFGLALAQKQKEHVNVELVIAVLGIKARRVLSILSTLCALVFISWLMVATLEEGIKSFTIREFRFGLLSVPIWPAKLAIPLGIAALIFEMITDLFGLNPVQNSSDNVITDRETRNE
jgi:TRAP-type C4-dicarboxylate transport system permease small subunit